MIMVLAAIWNLLALAWLTQRAGGAFPEAKDPVAVGLILLALAAFAAWKDEAVAGRCAGVIALVLAGLYALLLCSRRRRAREKALWLLSARDYAAGEMVAKLAPEAGQDIAEETVAALAEQGLIREEVYARRLAEEYCGRRHYPQKRAVLEMVRRGVDRDIAEQAVSENGSDDLQEALALLQKKRYTDTDKDKLRQKAFGFLARQGFDYSTARRAIERWSEEYAAGDPGDGGFADDR